MDASVRGLPLLSGPPPTREEPNSNTCRRCSKDLGMIFRTSRTCQMCGFHYCSSCCDNQALMPRSGSEAGYDPVNVCSFCIEPLTITASSRNQLRTTSVAKLRQYLKAFNISTPGALEKDDIVQAVLAARQPNGCLPPELESYYRKNSVPDQRRGRPERRSFLDRASDAAQAARHAFQEATGNPQNQNPNRDPGLRPPNSQRPPRPSSQPPPQTRPPPPPTNTRPQQVPRPQQQYAYPQYGHPYASPPRAPPRPTPTTAQQTRPPTAPARTPRPPTPIPPLSSLLDKTTEELNALSVHVLKEILHQNHVNARLLLEKSDLVDRVKMLIDDERREREREEEMRRLEEQEAIDLQHRMMAELRAREQERERLMREQAAAASAATAEASQTASGEASSAAAGEGTTEATPPSPGAPEDQTQESKATPTPAPAPAPPKPAPLPHVMERSGLCVVCQDADANMALVDCGHLALCKTCSDLIWSTTRECPLCRTRIVTQERMLRIFRT